MVWNKTYGHPEHADYIYCVQETTDLGYILAGSFGSRPEDYGARFTLIRTDANGTVEWTKEIPTTSPFESPSGSASSVQQTDDGGFIAVGEISPGHYNTDVWLVKTDASGELLWNQTFSYSTENHYNLGNMVIQTADGGYIVAGSTWVNEERGTDFWVIKVMRANPPVASFTFAPQYPAIRDEMVFNASLSFDLDGDIVSYVWDFDDGNVTSSTTPIISHTYEFPQKYFVNLTVIDAEDLNSSYLQLVWVRMVTTISISTRTSTTVVGFTVNITGTLLDAYGESMKNEVVTLHFAPCGSQTWTLLTYAVTDSLGDYFAMWIPQVTGCFALRAGYAGNITHAESSSNVTLSIVPYQNQYLFSVESNSTVSDLTFDTTSRRLSFSVSGENGTVGCTRVTIAKKLIADIVTVKIRVDGVEYNYTVADADASWVLMFTYNHSVHQVEVDLQEAMRTSDINGDGKVDMRDIGYVARRFVCVPGDSLWDPAADLNGDSTINMVDIGTVASHYGQRYLL
jgi:PKD repeat protein